MDKCSEQYYERIINHHKAKNKMMQTEIDELKNSVFQYGIENTKLQTERDTIQAEVDELKNKIAHYLIEAESKEVILEKEYKPALEALVNYLGWAEKYGYHNLLIKIPTHE